MRMQMLMKRTIVCAALSVLWSHSVDRIAAQDAAGGYAAADIAYGARLYTAQCATCHGPNGDMVGGVDLKSGKFRNATTDQDLTRVIAIGFPNAGMPAFRFDPAEFAGIIAYLRNMTTFDAGSAKAGDVDRGRALFEGRGGCTRCHRVDAKGARVAPDLSDIGANRSAGSLQRSLVDPNSQMMPINRPVRIVTRDGKTINGRRLNEDTYTVQILDEQERLLSFNKAELREFTILTTSPMPSFRDQLSADDLADLVAYLLSLKGR